MKTITIPTKFGYPKFDMYINGKKYTLTSGEEITVEDYVADVIENAIALAPKEGRYKSRFAQHAEGNITELTLSDLSGVENIAYYAFAYSKKLIKAEIPSSVTSLGDGVFYGCNKLESVRFEANSKLQSIGSVVFNFCNLLSVFLPENPPTLANIDAFANTKTSCIFYCKTQESLDAYKKAENWSTLTNTYTFVVEG